MNLSVAPTQFTEGEALELTDYRPVNRLAVLSAIFGGLSALAVLHPMLLALPLFGAATGFLAVWQLSSPNSIQSGNTAAKLGIFLSLVFGIWISTATVSRQQLLNKQARMYAQQWLEVVREGKLQEAHQLTLQQARRATSESALEDYYKEKVRDTSKSKDSMRGMSDMMEPSGHELFDQLYSHPGMKRITDLGKDAKFEYLRTVAQIKTSSSSLTVTQQFGVSSNRGGNTERFVVEITLERSEYNRIANWRVDENIRQP